MNTNESNNKSLILLRGLPGCGKTTLAGILCENGKYPVFSVDSFFTDQETGEYNFNYQNNHLAYSQCETNTVEALQRGHEKIFVDNTFTLEWEMLPYMKMAAQYGYRVFVITVENRHGGINSHSITDEQIEKMAAKYTINLTGK
jgi:predicted kinase